MSHFKERKEKNCLNCNAIVHDRFCGICGQENIEPKESAWHLMKHFFEDITHFDGKFFSSLKYLIFKPGFLSSEYVRGRRQAYLNPVRFYIFTSFIFFLVMFTFFTSENNFQTKNKTEQSQGIKVKPSNDKTHFNFFKFNNSKKEDSVKRDNSRQNINNPNENSFTFTDFVNRQEYDSLEKIGKLNIGWFRKKLAEKQFSLNEKFGNNHEEIRNSFSEIAKHNVPQVLFFTLPFFALCLKLIYIRRKNFYYVSHLIFTLHCYIFFYVSFLVINILGALDNYFSHSIFYYLTIPIGFGLPFYLYKAIRNFYQQSRLKTIFKLMVLSFLSIFVFLVFVVILLLLSIYKL